MIVDHQVGASVALGDGDGMYKAIQALSDPAARADIPIKARAFLEDELDVIHCYRRLINALDSMHAC
jgi:hypothetical protein